MPLDGFDFRNPSYRPVFEERERVLLRIREDKTGETLRALKVYYRKHKADFINDWGVTFDPRNAGTGRPAYLPFLLFERQREWVEWMDRRLEANESGACEKARDMGISWLCAAYGATLCLFNEDMVVGFASRKEEYVDKLDDPECLFWKVRQFVWNLPPEFTGTWDIGRHAPHMRIIFPDTGSVISGESGDQVGRGARARVYFVDEAAYFERPNLVEASLSQTTNCRIDVSSANGTANPFFNKRQRWAGTDRLFTFPWRSDPRKDQAWYDKQCEDLDPVVVAQEIDIDYTASVEGVLIPQAWVLAAIDADRKLDLDMRSGSARVGLDVADDGADKNAFVGGPGSTVERVRQWSGKTIDIYQTVVNAFAFCDDFGWSSLFYDGDGVGSGARGDARVINQQRERKVATEPYLGSGAPEHPLREDEHGRKNKDFFANRKAQAWWRTRKRFERTWRAVTKGVVYSPDQMINLDSDRIGQTGLALLTAQLSQPTFTRNEAGKIVVDKTPEGAKSPDAADALVIWSECSGDRAAEFFEEGNIILDAKPMPPPANFETAFASMHAAGKPGKDNSGVGVCYWAVSLDNDNIFCLGWDLAELEGNIIDGWLPRVFQRLDNYSARARLGSMGIFLLPSSENEVIAEKAASYGDAQVLDGKVTELDAKAQAIAISPHIAGKRVRLAPDAVEQVSMFRGSERNHLVAQVRAFSPDAKDVEDMAMLRAFVAGVHIGLEDD